MLNEKRYILIDTDLGDDTDDAAALIMALNSPELDIVGITTVFCNTQKRARMVQDLCSWYGREDIPVCAGYGRAIIERSVKQEEPIQYSIFRKEKTYPELVEQDGADFIIQKVREYPNLTIVAIGAMTNLGIAFYREPELMKDVTVLAMGGVFTSSAPEWNIKCDPEAARLVTDYAEHLKMFGLDVTKYCGISDEVLTKLCPKGNERMEYFRYGVEMFCRRTGFSVTFHDVLVMAYLLDESVVEMKKSDFTIELSGGITRGAIVFNTNAYDIHVETEKDFSYATSVDVEKFQKLVCERIF